MKKTFGFVVIIILISIFLGCTKTQYIAKDQDSNIKIGSQVWMAENLNVSHYRNGDPIPQVQDRYKWTKLKTGAWCYLDNESGNGFEYGKLYNWYAVNDPRGLAPKGWHIPTYAEFQILSYAVGGDGNTLKAIGQGTGGGAGTNTSGFSALLASSRFGNGTFYSLGTRAQFWSSTEYGSSSIYAYGLYLADDYSDIKLRTDTKNRGFSVRCLKD